MHLPRGKRYAPTLAHSPGFSKIENLEYNTKLLTLYLQENLIETIEGLDSLRNLRQLNLSDNLIKRVEGLGELKMLDTLLLKRNRIGKEGDVDDIRGLLDCPTLSCVDISDNYVESANALEEVFVRMPRLGVLYFTNNPAIKKTRNYKKTYIAQIPTLKYLDDRPVFEEDRRYAEAFARGGMDEERKERKLVK